MMAAEIANLPEIQSRLAAAQGAIVSSSRKAFSDEAQKVTDAATPLIEVLTGRARGSVHVTSQGDVVEVQGGDGVPYWRWLRFGGSVGRDHAVSREVVAQGRYFPAPAAMEAKVESATASAMKAALGGL